METKTIRITITNDECEILDTITMEIPKDHVMVAVRSHPTTISPSGFDTELQIGR